MKNLPQVIKTYLTGMTYNKLVITIMKKIVSKLKNGIVKLNKLKQGKYIKRKLQTGRNRLKLVTAISKLMDSHLSFCVNT